MIKLSKGNSKIDKSEVKSIIKETEKSVSFLNENGKRQMKFAKDYLKKIELHDLSGNRILFSPLDKKLLQHLIFSIVSEYENRRERWDSLR